MGYTNPDKDFYTTDAFTTYAIERLEEYKGEDKPFLLYLPYTAPHYPLHAWPEDIAKYRGKFKVGWDVIRQQRYERMMKMGIIDKAHELSPREPKVQAWDELSDEQKDAEDLKMAVYCAMIDRVDQNLGRVFAKVKELGEWDNTLIMFLTDNGGCPEQPNTTPNIPPGPVESYRTVSVGWANASNTPVPQVQVDRLRGRRLHAVHRPLARRHQTRHHRAGRPHHRHHPDLHGHHRRGVPRRDQRQQDQAGRRQVPAADLPRQACANRIPRSTGSSAPPRPSGRATGSWCRQGNAPWELYNLKDDKTELKDLAAKHPEKAGELAGMWEKWFASHKGNSK